MKLNLCFFFPRVWKYEALQEVGECFAERVGERLPRLLRWSARKQPQHRTYDAFFKNIKLHVYATLRPTDAEAQQPSFSTLVSYDEPPVPILDDIARTVVAPQFNALGGDDRDSGHASRGDSKEEASEGGRSEKQTSESDEEKGALGSDLDGEDNEDTGESHGEGSSAGEDTRGGARGTCSSPRPPRDPSLERRSTTQARAVGTSAPGLTRGDVEELLLDQRILFEMRLRTVKLEIQQHVTSECTSLREFLAALVARAGLTTAEPTTRVETEAGISSSLPEDIYGGPAEPYPYELDIAIDTGNMQDIRSTHCAKPGRSEPASVRYKRRSAKYCVLYEGYFQLYLTACTLAYVLYWSDAGATEPSNDAGDDDEEADGCDATDGDGVVTEVPAPGSIPEARARVPTMRRRSARLRRPTIATRTPNTGRGQREPRSSCS
ncbi:Hypothetical predicted protein [Olea europaea subsp. europaea]|uniref:Uncharacterized protein n=1 Tax=Olea europaea subsp. europaea TaxID=158383 RepID=A0A8S0QKI3_OLEEU|nr:Hypothetical predicted protein [Olea europaea subsp. europaea]